MLCLRRKGKLSWKDKLKNGVLDKLKSERTLLFDTQKRKCNYYGYIKRENNILATAVEEKNPNQRQKTKRATQ